jgi:hypothetical protein
VNRARCAPPSRELTISSRKAERSAKSATVRDGPAAKDADERSEFSEERMSLEESVSVYARVIQKDACALARASPPSNAVCGGRAAPKRARAITAGWVREDSPLVNEVACEGCG